MVTRFIWPITEPPILRRTLEQFNDEVIRFSKIPEYSDNATAVVAGLQPGELYHTSGSVKVVI